MSVTNLPVAEAVAATATAQPTPNGDVRLKMSYEEFLRTTDESKHAEWVNGETIIFIPPTTDHQRLVGFLYALLLNFVHHFQLGEVFVAPYEMKLTAEGSSREPDILFIATEHLTRLEAKRLEGPADLIIEVISPSSVYRDRSDKFDEYEAAGVHEYWLVDGREDKQNASFWVLDESGKYRAALVDEHGVYRSTVIPKLWLKLEWLWTAEPVSPILAFAEIAGLPDEMVEVLRQSAGR